MGSSSKIKGLQLQYAAAGLSLGSLAHYVHWVNQIPFLSQEEEVSLATRLQEKGDLDAARKMVLSHLRFVVKVARSYAGYGLAEADLIQEGNIGLMKAVKRFNPKVGVRLVSFAIHWIRAEIHEFILKNWRIVKIATTKAQRKLFFNFRKFSQSLGWLSKEETQQIASELNVSTKDVLQMESRLKNYDQSFESNEHDEEDSESHWGAPAHFLEDKRYDPAMDLEGDDWSKKQVDQLEQAMTHLDERSRDILQKRWLNEAKLTLHDLAAHYGISAERVRQLENNAMKKLRQALLQ